MEESGDRSMLKEKCRILQFRDLGDERGKLVVIEGNESIPFEIKRVFYIYGSDDSVIRGQHANKESEFVLINVSGKSKVRITDGTEEIIVELNRPMMGVYIPKMIWKDMYDFSTDSVLLVLASTHYDGEEYIRNYDEYIALPDVRNLKLQDDILPVLSLCMPTNGVSEWVFPSLNSIYSQGVDESRFEVIIMDNGDNIDFKKEVERYAKNHNNLKYYHTNKALFLSEPESYKKATGELIKFVNHRNIMKPGSVRYLIDFAEKNRESKPIIYYSNGVTRQRNKIIHYSSFGEFVQALEYYSTWSSGMTIWKSDMDSFRTSDEYNFLFPHTNILFHRRDASSYIIDGTNLWDEVMPNKKPKGAYDLFYAFSVEYISILLGLVRDGDLSIDQFMSVKKDNLDFITKMYWDYVIFRKYCSYDLTNCDKSIGVFYSKNKVICNIIPMYMKKAARKVLRLCKK